MTSFLIIYSSTDGHTKIICDRIKKTLEDRNSVELVSLEDVKKIDLSKFEKIIIGASIRYGKYRESLFDFIDKNKNTIDTKKNAFFSVNVVARKKEKNKPETNPYVSKFLKNTNWIPKKIGVFAGKIDYPKYKLLDKYAIKFIMLITKGPTDTSKTYEFTDWDMVIEFARNI